MTNIFFLLRTSFNSFVHNKINCFSTTFTLQKKILEHLPVVISTVPAMHRSGATWGAREAF